MTDTDATIELTPKSKPPPIPDDPTPLVEPELPLVEPLRPIETIAVIAMACLADFLLYTTLGATGAALVLLTALAGVTGLLGKPRGFGETCLFVFVALCSAMMMWRHWWLLEIMGWTSVFILAAKKKNACRCIPEAMLASAGALAAAPIQVIAHTSMLRRCFRKSGPGKTSKPAFPAKAVFIPLAVCCVFLIIFSNANPVVARILWDIADKITVFFDRFWEYVSVQRFVVWMLWLTAFSALTAPLLRQAISDLMLSLNESLDGDEQAEPADGTPLAALTTLVMINLLFLAYNCLDSVYLYFRATLPSGIGWTAYTHAGCGWLTFGLFLSTLIIGYIFRSGLNFCTGSKKLKTLSYIWAAQNILLAIGSMRRLQMYIDYSGLTHLRITGIYGSILVAVGLIIMVRKVQMNRSAIWMLRSYSLAFYAAVCILAITPNDFWCAKYNAAQIKVGKPRALRPVALKTLSAESLPPLIPLLEGGSWYDTEGKTLVIRRGIAALISSHLDRLDKRDTDWRKWQASEAWAIKRLEPMRKQLATLSPPENREKDIRILRTDYDLDSSYSPSSW